MDEMKGTSNRKYAYLALGLIVITWLVMDFNGRMSQLRRITNERDEVSANLVNKAETRSALETSIAYATSDMIVDEYSYVDAHKVQHGDIPIILVQRGDSTPVPSIQPIVAAEQPEKGNAWLMLFFGD